MATRSDFILSCTVDFPDDVSHGSYTLKLLDKMMVQIRSMGVSRIYWLYYGDINQNSYWAGNLFQHRLMTYGPQTIERIGEPLKAAVPIAHKYGMEIYGVLKPYNTGASGSYPEGSALANATSLKRIGGTLWQAIPFIQSHPEVRLKRRPVEIPDTLNSTTIKKIRLVKSDSSPTRITRNHLQIWTSQENWKYAHKDNLNFTIKDAVEPAPSEIHDYYGNLITAKAAPVRTLTIEGLDLRDKYILVTTDFNDGNGDFSNTGIGMIEAFGDDSSPLPIEVATLSTVWNGPRDFRTGGLEFDSGFGTLAVTLDTNNQKQEGVDEWESHQRGGVIAFARGKNDYLPSTPCEIYPGVRKLWAGWVDRILDTGVDGIDIRISHHGSIVDEPLAYGFNEPILAEFSQRFGAEPSHSYEDIRRLATIRGDHYTNFFRETSRKTRERGKKMQFHLHTEAFHSKPVHGQVIGFPPNIFFDWKLWIDEGLADGITFRTSWFEGWEDPPQGEPNRQQLTRSLGDPVAREALKYANQAEVPVYLNRYISRAVGNDEYVADLDKVYRDPRFSGFDIYEWASLAHSNPDGTLLEPILDGIQKIRSQTHELGFT